MEKKLSKISSLHANSYRYKINVKVYVRNKSNVLYSKNGTKFFNVEVCDNTGQIQITGFSSEVDKFYKHIEPKKTYLISGLKIKTAKQGFYCINPNKLELIMESWTEIQECPEESTLSSQASQPSSSSQANSQRTSICGLDFKNWQSIESIRPNIPPHQQKQLLLKVRIRNKTNKRPYKTGAGNLFSFDVYDDSGEIRISCFGDAIDKFYDKIELNAVYYIAGFKIKPVKADYNDLKNQSELILEKWGDLQQCQESQNLPKLECPIDISDMAWEDISINDFLETEEVPKTTKNLQIAALPNNEETNLSANPISTFIPERSSSSKSIGIPTFATQSNKRSRSPDIIPISNDAKKIKISPELTKWQAIASIELCTNQNLLKLRARIRSKTNIRSYRNNNGRLFSFVAFDESGEIEITGFDFAIKFYNQIEINKAYFISGLKIRESTKKFIKHPCQLILQNFAVIKECNQNEIPKITYNFVRIGSLINHDPKEPLNIIGICISVGEVEQLTTKNGKQAKKRDITLVDQSNVMINLTLWAAIAENFKYESNPVILIQDADLHEYYGSKSVTTKYSSTVKVNPDIPEANALHEWYENNANETSISSLSEIPTNFSSIIVPFDSFLTQIYVELKHLSPDSSPNVILPIIKSVIDDLQKSSLTPKSVPIAEFATHIDSQKNLNPEIVSINTLPSNDARKRDISPELTKWQAIASIQSSQYLIKVRVRVRSKTNIRPYGVSGEGRLYSFIAFDESGEIEITGFNSATKFYDQIEINKTYFISGLKIKEATGRFNKHQFQLILDKSAVIKECNQTEIPKITYNFVPIGSLGNLNPKQSFDIIGICKSVGKVQQFTTKTGKEAKKREITLLDQSNIFITLTLWAESAENFKYESNPVILIQNAELHEYLGSKSVTTKFTSTITVNPDIPEAKALQKWYKNNPIRNLSEAPTNTLPYLTIAEALKAQKTRVNNKIEFLCVGSSIYLKASIYKACIKQGCEKKVQEVGTEFLCPKCNTNSKLFKYRCVLNSLIADDLKVTWASVFSQEAEKILQKSAEELGELHEGNLVEYNKYLAQQRLKEFVFKIRLEPETYKGKIQNRGKIIGVESANSKSYMNHLTKTLYEAIEKRKQEEK